MIVPEEERIVLEDVQPPSKNVIQRPGPRVLKMSEMAENLVEVIERNSTVNSTK